MTVIFICLCENNTMGTFYVNAGIVDIIKVVVGC